ncbi:hypothetical protein OUZ56_004391 [Daphnia magna]|uniref:Uncharacterized protein n=1 Tax=Daphnia magna TaxID=35525 RepID=A0ABQ9YPS1_9CRUS|nr:hypothetical protein OUZ56_004391 [Daphnia magna]
MSNNRASNITSLQDFSFQLSGSAKSESVPLNDIVQYVFVRFCVWPSAGQWMRKKITANLRLKWKLRADSLSGTLP